MKLLKCEQEDDTNFDVDSGKMNISRKLHIRTKGTERCTASVDCNLIVLYIISFLFLNASFTSRGREGGNKIVLSRICFHKRGGLF